MTRWTWLLCALGALVLVVGPAMAADPAKEPAKTDEVKAPEAAKAEAPKAEAPKTEAPKAEEPKKAEEAKKPVLEGQLADMAKECKLSDEQQAKLLQVATEANAEIQQWQKTNADKLEAFRKAVQAAQESGDQEAMKKAYTDIMSLREESRALMMKHQNAIAAILTAEQKVAWQGYRLFVDVVSDLKGIVNLTDEQAPKVRPLCEEAAKDLTAIKDEGEAGMKARMAVQEKLLTGIKEKVLTPEQRTMLEAKLAPPEMPAPAPEKPAEKAPAPAAEKPAAEKAPAPAAEKSAAEKAPAPAAEKPAAEKPAAETPAPAPAPKAEK
jgi:Spy/CpxP family protein refolding chaperone